MTMTTTRLVNSNSESPWPTKSFGLSDLFISFHKRGMAACHTYNSFLVPKLTGGGIFPKRWRSQPLMVKSQMINNATTYTCSISTDIPLYEILGASFDGYLENKPQVFRAIFPDKTRSQQLNQCKLRNICSTMFSKTSKLLDASDTHTESIDDFQREFGQRRGRTHRKGKASLSIEKI